MVLGLWGESDALRAIGRAARDPARAALAAVGLEGFERAVGTPFGGQFQRALFARLLLQDARRLLLDEPFTALDARTPADLLALDCWHGEGGPSLRCCTTWSWSTEHFPEALLIARDNFGMGPDTEVLIRRQPPARAHEPSPGTKHGTCHRNAA